MQKNQLKLAHYALKLGALATMCNPSQAKAKAEDKLTIKTINTLMKDSHEPIKKVKKDSVTALKSLIKTNKAELQKMEAKIGKTNPVSNVVSRVKADNV